jgi:glycine/D-amino acid oxidase-like deaminating enzyme
VVAAYGQTVTSAARSAVLYLAFPEIQQEQCIMTSREPRTLAKKKDLHDGRSVWANSRHRTVRTVSTLRKLTPEIVVVGGGISGALCALELTTSGHEVVVVDRREPGAGSTLASTAMIQFELDVPLIRLGDKIGKPKAARAYQRSFQAVADLGKLIEKYGVESGWRDRQALYLAGSEMGFRGLEREAAARSRINLPSKFINAESLADQYGIKRTGAILSDGSAELDPARTAASCLRIAQRFGAKIVSPCEIVDVTCVKGGLELQTSAGSAITAKRVVFATGYEVVKGVPRDAFDIVSSWAIATQPIENRELWPGRCLIWEASNPYLYARTTVDNRILVGGEDSKLTNPKRRAAAIPAKAEALLKKIRSLLDKPGLQIDYAWAGAFAESPAGLPIIKELPHLRGAMAILGCGGNGITFSTIAAQIARQWASGKKDPDLDLFVGLT